MVAWDPLSPKRSTHVTTFVTSYVTPYTPPPSPHFPEYLPKNFKKPKIYLLASANFSVFKIMIFVVFYFVFFLFLQNAIVSYLFTIKEGFSCMDTDI